MHLGSVPASSSHGTFTAPEPRGCCFAAGFPGSARIGGRAAGALPAPGSSICRWTARRGRTAPTPVPESVSEPPGAPGSEGSEAGPGAQGRQPRRTGPAEGPLPPPFIAPRPALRASRAGSEACEGRPPPDAGTGQRSGMKLPQAQLPSARPGCPHTPPPAPGPDPPRPGGTAGGAPVPSPPSVGTYHAFLAEEAEEALILLRGEQQRAHISDPPRGLLLRGAAHGRGRPGAALAALRPMAPAAPSSPSSSSAAAAGASQQPHRGASSRGRGRREEKRGGGEGAGEGGGREKGCRAAV